MDLFFILLIHLGLFATGMLFINIGIHRGLESWLSELVGYSLAIVTASIFINYCLIALGADNSNDIFIGAVILGAFIAIITPKILFK